MDLSASPQCDSRHGHTPRCAQGIPACPFKMDLLGFGLMRFQVHGFYLEDHGT